MKRRIHKKQIIILLVFVILLFCGLYFKGNLNQKLEATLKKVQNTKNTLIKGRVDSVSHFKGHSYIRVYGSDSVYFLENSRNYNFFPYELYENLSYGDSIYKPKNSIEIKIFSKYSNTYFRLGKDLNKSQRK